MEKRQLLTGKWIFKSTDSDQYLPGEIPGCVQTDLIKLGKMPDPFYRQNENAFYALEDKEWVYLKEFTVEGDVNCYNQINLVFAGIDTIAQVYLNDELILDANNMFLSYTIPVKHLLKSGKNHLMVRFPPVISYIRALSKTAPANIHSSIEEGRPFIRKAQYSFGWDWGPRLVQTGIWRPVFLEFIKEAKVSEVFAYTKSQTEDQAVLQVEGAFESGQCLSSLEVKVNANFHGEAVARTTAHLLPAKCGGKFRAELRIPQPQLWYPNGVGEQPLYQITVSLEQAGKQLARKEITTGIRVVQLIRTKDEIGESFIFEINGKRVFAKGANWIPGDSFLARFTAQDYQRYIELAAEANMNMLRVWGGGIYEDPAFYEACDREGIMVWQDFMYACSEYPDNLDWFRKSALKEAEAVVKGLRNHPSIVLWCGNNEINWLYTEASKGKDLPHISGDIIFKQVLPDVCALDPSRPYWVSSPYGSAEDPNGMGEGNRHNWQVWSGWQDYGQYKMDTSRFITEFGFQAMPTWTTIKRFTTKEDRHILSPVILGHQKMVEGNERLLRFMVGRVGFPRDFLSFVYLSQFNQAEAIKTAVEHWRSRKYRTAGALYWQLNDCWPVASWSSVDYYQGKKGLYYYTKRFFAPVLPIIDFINGRISVRVVNDNQRDLTAKVKLSVYSLSGYKKAEQEFSRHVPRDSVAELDNYALEELNICYDPTILPRDHGSTTLQASVNKELLDTVIYVQLEVDGEVATNYFVFDKFRHLKLSAPQISVEKREESIILKTDRPAFGVFIHSDSAIDLSDNCLWMMPNQEYTVRGDFRDKEIQTLDLTQLIQDIY